MEKIDIGLLGIAYDKKSSFMQGPALAPPIIREVLHDSSSNYFAENGMDVMKDVNFSDLGDLSVQDYHDILPALKSRMQPNHKYIFLGGDHSITFPLVSAVTENHGRPINILHFDAHTDLYDDFEGDRYSHACPFARIMESCNVARLVQVGIRTVTSHQREQIEKFGVELIMMKDLHLLDQLQFRDDLYISIDLDGFDPAYAPGVSHHEPGGLSPREVINFLHTLTCNVLAVDIVEYNPLRDHSHMTAALAAKLIKEAAALLRQR